MVTVVNEGNRLSPCNRQVSLEVLLSELQNFRTVDSIFPAQQTGSTLRFQDLRNAGEPSDVEAQKLGLNLQVWDTAVASALQ